MADEFSADIKQFIDQNIESLPQLEALLLLHCESQRDWSIADLAKALYVPQELAGTLLADFCRSGFVKAVADDSYKYAVDDARINKVISEVADTYQDRRVAVISLIYSKPLNKVQTFADAFRLRKDELP